jgi:hypothetical protein
MPSNARQSFDKNAKDIRQLLKFHAESGGDAQGRRYGLEVLNKSAIVLITSFWEAYCEDIAAEALKHIVTHTPSAAKLPTELKKQMAKELKSDKNEIAVWGIADKGWQTVINARLAAMQEERNRKLNTPKSNQIDELFLSGIGIPAMSDSWHWKGMTVAQARAKLDKFVTLRGAIAHRGGAADSVTKSQVTNYFGFIKRLASKTGGKVNQHVKTITGKKLWE